jgi:peptide/nickel transport system substrate-binding protein
MGTHRGGTLVLVSAQRFASVDPAFYNVAQSPQFVGLAYDTLVTFQHSGGSDGLRLVPDLALAIPTPAHGGTTYRFRLRHGVRYSTGRLLRASDFRRAIERLFRVASPGASFFAGIVGARRCQRHPLGCRLGGGIVTDDGAGTVAFHLTAADPEFLFKLTEQGFSAPIPPESSDPPVPPARPDRAHRSLAPSGTGPYRIADADASHVRFVRNPFFREWSHAAQPDGNPDAIVWRFAPSTRAAVAAVEQQRADWLFGLVPPSQYRELHLRHPAELHVSPQFAVDFVPLNTHRPPFDDLRVRQALNYAIDRGRLARMYGGQPFAAPTCQPLAPGLPGYQRYCPYTLHRRANGAWSAPDLAKARRLVGESKTRGERIDVWGTSDESYMPPGVPAYVADVLRSLGYRIRLHIVSLASIKEAVRKHFQLSVDGDWVAEYPDPSAYIPQFFGCSGGTSNGYYCNPRLDQATQKASQLKLAKPTRSTALWTSVDHQLTDDAPWAPTINQQEVDLVSGRLHNYEYNPVWGFLADQSWLR